MKNAPFIHTFLSISLSETITLTRFHLIHLNTIRQLVEYMEHNPPTQTPKTPFQLILEYFTVYHFWCIYPLYKSRSSKNCHTLCFISHSSFFLTRIILYVYTKFHTSSHFTSCFHLIINFLELQFTKFREFTSCQISQNGNIQLDSFRYSPSDHMRDREEDEAE